jgi:DNA-binding transcriptional ArsR family regulator
MNAEPDIVRIASAVGDATRIRMLSLLMEGRALTAKELALGAGVEPATATSHLKRLLDDALVTSTSQGRHKYFRFASDDVAQLVETLMRVAPRKAATREVHEPIRAARFCYDHLAGTLGTGIFSSMLKKGWLADAGAEPNATRCDPQG